MIALTASTTAVEKKKRMAEGFDGYLLKPIKVSRLFKELSRCLDHARKEKEEDSPGFEASMDRLLEHIENHPEVKGILKETIAPAYETLAAAMKMRDIEALWKKLTKLAREHDVKPLRAYGERLRQSAKSYDLVDIDKIFHNFSETKNAGVSE